MVKLAFARMRKKGLLQSQAVGLVAALALGVLLLQLSKPFISAVQAQDLIEGCRLSVGLSSWQLQKDLWEINLPTLLDSPFELNCKTIFTEITKDSINRYDDKIKLSDDSNEKKEQLKELIMKSMRECWYMYGAGNVKVQQAVDTKGTACLVCSEIIPDNELMNEIRDKKKDPIVLDNMYTYASTATIPPKDEKTYLDYFLENTAYRPDLAKIPKKTITLNQQYSVVFAVTSKAENIRNAVFGRDSTGRAGAGIVDCYIGGSGKVPEGDAMDIGCKPDGTNPGLIFGKIIDGGTDLDLLNWKNLAPLAGLGEPIKLKTYPATVRLVPTSQLVNSCKRLY